jgi:hypothetical protein
LAARRSAALLLEVWSGVRTALSASEAMGVAVTRFYQLEARALQMMVSAMEPRPRGRQKTTESELCKLKVERQRLLRDVERFQSLYRTSQRALGVVMAKAPEPGKNAAPGGKRRRGPRKKARGQSVAAVLLGKGPPIGAEVATDGATEQGTGTHGQTARRSGGEEAGAAGAGHAHRPDQRG